MRGADSRGLGARLGASSARVRAPSAGTPACAPRNAAGRRASAPICRPIAGYLPPGHTRTIRRPPQPSWPDALPPARAGRGRDLGGDGGVAGVGVERVQRGREVEAREARPGELELDPGPQVHACDAGGASRRTAACALLCTRRARLVLHTGRLARSLRRSIQGAVHTPTAVNALAANGRMSRPRPPRARKSQLRSRHDSDRLGSQVTTRIQVARDEGGGGGPRPPGPRLLRTQLLMLIVNRGLQF